MGSHIQDVYIVAALRTPVGKARGVFAHTRPDDLLAVVLSQVMQKVPQLDKAQIEDVIIGCAMPEGEQGMNVARISALLAGYPNCVPALTVNRFCSSGLQSIAMAADRIASGQADIMVAGGVESMSRVPMGGYAFSQNPKLFEPEHADLLGIAYSMGITAEKVAEQYHITREQQDEFAYLSHTRALAALDNHDFEEELCMMDVKQDEGPRRDTNLEALAKLKPVFKLKGTVTAGNTSQMSDGAAALVLVSEKMLSQYDLHPLARFRGFSVAGVAPELMGIGPIAAVPKVLKQTGIKLSDISWIELNEAFAAQSLAVIQTLDLDPNIVNPKGGAIALGHPLGATGAIRSATLIHGMRRTKQKYGLVTMCIGTGMGAAGIFEIL